MTSSTTWSCAWLYWECVVVGLATGAAAGVVTGAFEGAQFGVAAGALTGGIIGTIVALFPSLLGASVVTEVIRRRHPVEVSTDDVRLDLGIVFGIVATAVNAAGLLAVAVYSDLSGILFLALGNAGALPVLWLGRAAIVKAWAGAPAN